MKKNAFEHLDFRLESSKNLSNSDLAKVHALFDFNYVQANHTYLDQSLAKLNRIALAFEEKTLVGFSLAGSTRMVLPRLQGQQMIMLGGIGCIDSRFRRLGLFSCLANLAGGQPREILFGVDRVLACSRIAHPASFRTIKHLPGSLPKLGQALSAWHLEVASVAASLYGVKLKPGSLIVQGSGKPIGYPCMEIDAGEEEWQPFATVDRDAGDSLMAIAWAPNAPDGW